MTRSGIRFEKIAPYVYAVGLFVLWEAAVRIGDMPVYILPAPSRIMVAIVEYWPAIWKNSLVTLWTTTAGFLLAVVGGLALGLLVGWSRSIYAGLYPLMIGFNAVPNGFLIDEVYTGSRVKVHKHKFKRSIDLDDLDLGPFEMAFIDAAHPHPWPLIDTLFVRPHMTGSKTVIHHDLELFTKQRVVLGIGPKYVWDQFPESARQRGEGGASNIFSVSLDIDDATFERIFCDGILLPWTSQLGPMVVHRVRKVVERTLSKRALDVFNEAMIRFNAPKK